MRVLYVLAFYPQNSESYVEAEMEFMVERGVEISVWSPTQGYGDPSSFQVYRGPLKDAIASVRPDVVHIHHMTTASRYVDELPKKSVTVRAHSFDWSDGLANQMIAHPSVRCLFAFPHLARRVSGTVPLPVAYSDKRIRRFDIKDPKLVVRLAAGLPTKNLVDFLKVGNRFKGEVSFTLAVTKGVGVERVADDLHNENKSLGGYVKILSNLSRGNAIGLMQAAGTYMSTYDASAHTFGMPISIAEAMATGAFVICREADGVSEYMGEAKVLYDSLDGAEELIRIATKFTDEDRWAIADVACRNAERFRASVVLPRLLEEWNAICLDNF